MKQLRSIYTIIIFCAALNLVTQNSSGQNINPGEMKTAMHVIHSKVNNKAYELSVLLPKKYSTADTVHYPVLYVLDGKFSFTLFYSILNLFSLGKEVKDVIIVAVDAATKTDEDWQASRYHDLTPSNIPQSDTLWSKIMNMPYGKLTSGGAKDFLNVLQTELIPYIDKNYKTTADRGLSGHSLGGLFVSYCLLTQPTLFSRYAINSPSLWWNGSEMISLENAFAKQDTTISAKVFFSIGALEGDMMINPFTAFTKSFKNHDYKGLQMTTAIFEEETHLSVVAACSSRTLKVLYGVNTK